MISTLAYVIVQIRPCFIVQLKLAAFVALAHIN